MVSCITKSAIRPPGLLDHQNERSVEGPCIVGHIRMLPFRVVLLRAFMFLKGINQKDGLSQKNLVAIRHKFATN